MMETVSQLYEIAAVIGFLFAVVSAVTAIVLWVKGIAPVLYRLGNGLAHRRIAIFAKGDNLASISTLLSDSNLIAAKNVVAIPNINDLGKAEKATLFLVFWSDYSDCIEEVLKKKKDSCALIVYAPRHLGMISEEAMKTLDSHRNTAVTNFRGRLLSDIVSAMITTGYEKA